VLKHAETYEIMRPEDVGVRATSLVMGKHSGRHAFREKLKELGFELGDNALEDAFKRFKDLADRKKHIFDEDIVALVEDEMMQAGEAIRLVALTVIAGTGGPQKAIVTLDVDGQHITKEAVGDGPVDAMFKAIRAIAPHEGTLQLYQVGAVTEDSDAQADVSVRLGEGDKVVIGRGADTDTMVASAKAYVSAVNKLITKRQRIHAQASTA
jgi:2-isopropylmalate synthase